MVLPQLIRYVLVVACRQSTVNASVSALAAVFLVSVGLLLINTAGGPVSLDEMKCAESDNCELGQYAEQEPDKEQMESLGRVEGESGAEGVDDNKTLPALTKQSRLHPTQIAEWKQQQVDRAADAFGEVTP